MKLRERKGFVTMLVVKFLKMFLNDIVEDFIFLKDRNEARGLGKKI